MIKIFHLAGRYAPVVVCDICSKRIERAEQGVAISPVPSTDTGVLNLDDLATLSEIGDPEEFEVFHVHKDQCTTLLEQRLQHTAHGSYGLDEHLYYIAGNLGLTLNDLRRVEDDPE